MALCIDFREKALIQMLQCWKPTVLSLPVGDLTCSYEDNSAWVLERKSANDLAGSIIDGRLADQTARLMCSGYSHVFLIVEGDLSSTALPHETLLGACINAELRPGSHLIRTACIEESVLVIQQLVKKCPNPINPVLCAPSSLSLMQSNPFGHLWPYMSPSSLCLFLGLQ